MRFPFPNKMFEIGKPGPCRAEQSLTIDFNDLSIFVPETLVAVDSGPADEPEQDDNQSNNADDTEPILVHNQLLSSWFQDVPVTEYS